jgi:tetratricopeptide (TPR) repeat protein
MPISDLEKHQIGSTVRIASTVLAKSALHNRNHHETRSISRRGLLATINDGDREKMTCTLILEDLVPTSLSGSFLIAPCFNNGKSIEESEVEVPASDIMPLLSFEHSTTEEMANDVTKFKEWGDQLFKLHDYTRAISYYEAALQHISSNFTNVGSTLVVRRNGHCVVAELDCIETDGDNSQCDVTFILPNGKTEEDVISSKDILFSVWDQDGARRGKRDKSNDKFLQPRILLNLCRSLLHLAEIHDDNGNTIASISNRDYQTKYKKSAVLASSIAITLCEYYENETDTESQMLTLLVEKAYILRSKAFVELGKLPNAMSDAKKVLNQSPNQNEAAELLRDIRLLEKHRKKSDRKLSKEVCRWVQSATNDL